MRYVTLPGIGGSGDEHWQSFWERDDPKFERIDVMDWAMPDLQEWLEAVDTVVFKTKERCVLVAHSLSCLLAAEYVLRNPGAVAGVFLVAPPDPTSEPFPRRRAKDFMDIGLHPLDCPSIVLASTNDPYGTIDYARARATKWRAEFLELGEYGHISDLGSWSEGRQLLRAFGAGLDAIPARYQKEIGHEA